jgi:hypothetical protein
MIRSVRSVVASAALVSCLVGVTAAYAIAPHPVTSGDMFGAIEAGFSTVTVAGQTFQNALYLGRGGAEISINMNPFRAYNALAFDLGADDGTYANTTGSVIIYGDGKQLASFTATPRVPVRHEVVGLGGHTIIRLVRQSSDNTGAYVFVNPQLIHQGPTPPPPPSMTLESGTTTVGSQQAVDVSTQARKAVTVMVVFANGTHLVDGPHLSGPTGHYLYTFNVPNRTKGMAQVVAVIGGSGVAQMTFTVSS